MLTLLMALAAGAVTSNQAIETESCQVGRVALQDLPTFNANPTYASYYANPGNGRKDLLDVCPALKRLVPQGYPFADDQARARAQAHFPLPGQVAPPATMIYSIDPPQVAQDGTTAFFTIRTECSGLCGGYTTYRYLRTSTGWHKGKAEVMVVS